MKKWFTLSLFVVLLLVFAPTADAQDDNKVELVGVIETLSDTTLTLNGQEIDITQAEIKVQLEVGLAVKVEANLLSDSSLVAYEVKGIEDSLAPDESEIVGTLESIDDDTVVVSGLSFDISSAEIDPALTVGDTVVVHFTLTDAGVWVAREVERVDFFNDDNDLDEDFKFTGTLEEIGENFVVVASMTFDTTNAEVDNNLVIGSLVEVETIFVDNALVASEVHTGDQDDDDIFILPGDCSMPDGWTTYTIQPGDTLATIADATNTPIVLLVAVNCIENPNLISPDAVLFVPTQPLFDDDSSDDDSDSSDDDSSDDDNDSSDDDNSDDDNDSSDDDNSDDDNDSSDDDNSDDD